MPAMLDDPASPTIYRVSGALPFPDPNRPELPADMAPLQVTLRDRQTVATIVPFASHEALPKSLLAYLCDQLNKEIAGGDTYPMMDLFQADKFAAYWFQNFGAVMLLGHVQSAADIVEGKDWARECLGSFYIKPNYPGRSSHVCNAGFLVTDASRNRGVGRLMGEAYIDWAPRLGYSYSVFNLVYETNVASCKIWDALGFKRIGRVKGCGNLKSFPGQLVDAIIYGRDLAPGADADELVSEERFDKIRFYLKYGKYPNGADRAEKSRLRSAATHYKLLDGDKLMLKDKEVIADPVRQFEIARGVHALQHGGINKTTATIAEKYHWSRIKETVSDVIRSCAECKELGKTPSAGGMRRGAGATPAPTTAAAAVATGTQGRDARRDQAAMTLSLQSNTIMPALSQPSSSPSPGPYAHPSDMTVISPSHTLHSSPGDHPPPLPHSPPFLHPHHSSSSSSSHHRHHQNPHHNPMLQDPPAAAAAASSAYQPIDPQMMAAPAAFESYHAHADFQALLNATEDPVDRDLDMLIEPQDDDDDDDVEAMVSPGRTGAFYGFAPPGG